MFLRVLLLCLLHTILCRGQSLIGSTQPIVATIGEDVILPCVFKPPRDVTDFTLEWSRPDLDPRFVYVWRSQDELPDVKNPRFIGRTSLFTDELKNGNISLKLTKVKTSDSGTYRCYLPIQDIDTSVKLNVGWSSPPVVSVSSVDVWRSAVVLQCDSGAWYPEPELLWLDSEGRLLSAERTHTHTRPDGLYNVSSRVTVEQSSTFTCRVSQSSTNITTHTSFQVPDSVFQVNFRRTIIILIVVAALFFGIIVVGIIVFIRRRRKYSKYQATKNSPDEAEAAVDVEEVHEETGDQDQEINTENHLAEVERVTEETELNKEVHPEFERTLSPPSHKVDSAHPWGHVTETQQNCTVLKPTGNSPEEAVRAVEDVPKETGDESPKAQDQEINTENHLEQAEIISDRDQCPVAVPEEDKALTTPERDRCLEEASGQDREQGPAITANQAEEGLGPVAATAAKKRRLNPEVGATQGRRKEPEPRAELRVELQTQVHPESGRPLSPPSHTVLNQSSLPDLPLDSAHHQSHETETQQNSTVLSKATKNSPDEAEAAVDVEEVHEETGDESPEAQDQEINTENHLPQEEKYSDKMKETKRIIIDSIDQKGTNVRLRNTAEKTPQQMRNWTVKIELVNKESYIYKFSNNFHLKPQSTVTIWAEGCCPTSASPDPLNTDLEWKNQAPWNKAQRVTVSIYNQRKQLMDSQSVEFISTIPS